MEESVIGDFREAFRLTREESKTDPLEEPYLSLYAARELWSGAKAKIDSSPHDLRELEDFKVLSAHVQLELGLNYCNTDEFGSAGTAFDSCLRLLDNVSNKVKTACLSMQAYNQLGVLWGNRSEHQKSLEYLLKAKAVYESHVALPPPITETQWLLAEEPSEWEREKVFENLHTHTLFFLAQVYGNLDQPKLSAQYCQDTLSRQLESQEYDSIEWSLNCATISQYHFNVGNYRQARHCLAAAESVLEKGRQDSGSEGESDEMQEKFKQASADVSRCWSKYCLSILKQSIEDIEEEERVEQPQRRKFHLFDSLEVSDLESAVPYEPFESYDAAKTTFLAGQKYLNLAKEFYTLESYASEAVAIVQDHSQLFKLLAFFESDTALKCRMHKRRVDMLSSLLASLNPQHYLMVCRQIMFELGEAQSEMADLKIVSGSESPSPHAIGKINKLNTSAIQYYDRFLESFEDPSTHCLPDVIEEDYLRPVLCAKLYTARLHSRFICPDPATKVEPNLFVARNVVFYYNVCAPTVEKCGIQAPFTIKKGVHSPWIVFPLTHNSTLAGAMKLKYYSTILVLLRCPFRWYPFLPASRFSSSGRKQSKRY